ncbi:hypothetical protein, partial [Henriciella pelagia]|uniref:hypothetical protein n=1 Tax=Henriciella pelagia TaxID=1977912 RepID=UPI0035197527
LPSMRVTMAPKWTGAAKASSCISTWLAFYGCYYPFDLVPEYDNLFHQITIISKGEAAYAQHTATDTFSAETNPD